MSNVPNIPCCFADVYPTNVSLAWAICSYHAVESQPSAVAYYWQFRLLDSGAEVNRRASMCTYGSPALTCIPTPISPLLFVFCKKLYLIFLTGIERRCMPRRRFPLLVWLAWQPDRHFEARETGISAPATLNSAGRHRYARQVTKCTHLNQITQSYRALFPTKRISPAKIHSLAAARWCAGSSSLVV